MSEDFGDTRRQLSAAKQGDRSTLTGLLRRYGDPLLGAIRGMLGEEIRDFAQSQDFLQDLFVDILEDYDPARFDSEEEFLRWARQVARNNVRGVARRRRIRQAERLATAGDGGAPEAGLASPLTRAVDAEERRMLEQALAELPREERVLVELRDEQRLSWAEIATRLGAASPDAIRVKHARVLARITTRIQNRDQH